MKRLRHISKDGTALIIVVAIVAVLTPLVIHYHSRAADRLRLAARTSRHSQALSLARCGVYLAWEALSKDNRPFFYLPHCNPEKPMLTEGRPTDLEKAYLWMNKSRETPQNFENGTLQIFLDDDMGRLSLNRTQTNDLAAAIKSLGVTKIETTDIFKDEKKVDRSREMAAAIVDWRDSNGSPEMGIGAEDKEYMNQEPPYRCRNAPFQSLGELTLVRDFDSETMKQFKLDEVVTVFGPGFHVNANTASAIVLSALPGISTSGQKAEIIAEIQRNRPYRSLAELRSAVTSVDSTVWNQLFRRITLNSNRYRIKVVGAAKGVEATVEAVLQKRGRDFLVLAWKER